MHTMFLCALHLHIDYYFDVQMYMNFTFRSLTLCMLYLLATL